MGKLMPGTIAHDRLPGLIGKVFISGGTGFLGRAILRRAEKEHWDCQITAMSRDEEKLWKAKDRFGKLVNCVLGDVRDQHNLNIAMRGHETVIHAAAIKFIPEAEANVFETVKTNVDGSRNVMRAAVRAGVERVVAISTDKAALPANTYGMTKALMERMFAEANAWGNTRFVAVRYGNVVGSTGSIIPIFKHQKEKYGRVKITDENMTRFWLSADEAIDLILLALAKAEELPGRIFVPRCGAMYIKDLAQLLADGVPIDVIGIRPGEKLHEDLVNYQESPRVDLLADYFVIHPAMHAAEGGSWTYRSSSPAVWITLKEMSAMIKDAEDI